MKRTRPPVVLLEALENRCLPDATHLSGLGHLLEPAASAGTVVARPAASLVAVFGNDATSGGHGPRAEADASPGLGGASHDRSIGADNLSRREGTNQEHHPSAPTVTEEGEEGEQGQSADAPGAGDGRSDDRGRSNGDNGHHGGGQGLEPQGNGNAFGHAKHNDGDPPPDPGPENDGGGGHGGQSDDPGGGGSGTGDNGHSGGDGSSTDPGPGHDGDGGDGGGAGDPGGSDGTGSDGNGHSRGHGGSTNPGIGHHGGGNDGQSEGDRGSTGSGAGHGGGTTPDPQSNASTDGAFAGHAGTDPVVDNPESFVAEAAGSSAVRMPGGTDEGILGSNRSTGEQPAPIATVALRGAAEAVPGSAAAELMSVPPSVVDAAFAASSSSTAAFDLLSGFLPVEAGNLEAAMDEVLAHIDDLGSQLTSAARDFGWSPFLIGAAAAVVAYQLAVRSRKPAAGASGWAAVNEASTASGLASLSGTTLPT